MDLAQIEGLPVRGDLKIVLFDAEGREKERHHFTNLVVTAGKGVIADRMKGTPAKAAMTMTVYCPASGPSNAIRRAVIEIPPVVVGSGMRFSE